MVLVVSVIATVIVYFVVLDTQNVGTLFLLFFLIFEFGISMIMFAFIFTTLFSNAKVNINDLSLTFPVVHTVWKMLKKVSSVRAKRGMSISRLFFTLFKKSSKWDIFVWISKTVICHLFVSGCGWCWRSGYYHGCLFLLHSSLCWRSSHGYFLGAILVIATCFCHGHWQSKQ